MARNRDFRHALALGIDRDQLNEAFWLGVGTAGSSARPRHDPYSPGPEWSKKWAVLDVAQANKLLDKIGLTKKDAEGYRLRTDKGQRLRIEMVTGQGGHSCRSRKIGEMIAQQWRKIGIFATSRSRSAASPSSARRDGNENQIIIWANDGSEMLYLFPRHALPVDAAERRLDGHGVREVVRVQRRPRARSPTIPEMLKALELFRASASARRPSASRPRRRSGRSSSTSRPGHRHGRPVAGLHGRAPGQEQPGQHPRAGSSTPSTCRTPALVATRRSTSRAS